MNRGCSHEGLWHLVLNHQLLISHVKRLSSRASPRGGSKSLAGRTTAPRGAVLIPACLSCGEPGCLGFCYRLHPIAWHA